jgi:hypothetical protein
MWRWRGILDLVRSCVVLHELNDGCRMPWAASVGGQWEGEGESRVAVGLGDAQPG